MGCLSPRLLILQKSCIFSVHFYTLFCYFVDSTAILQLRNSRGHVLQCSHYVPSTFPNDTSLPCVIYCHGNRYHMVVLSTLCLEIWFFSIVVYLLVSCMFLFKNCLCSLYVKYFQALFFSVCGGERKSTEKRILLYVVQRTLVYVNLICRVYLTRGLIPIGILSSLYAHF